MAKAKAHPGFKSVQSAIAKKQGVSKKAAGGMLASATRKTSPMAKKANPKLNNVAMPKVSKGMAAMKNMAMGKAVMAMAKPKGRSKKGSK